MKYVNGFFFEFQRTLCINAWAAIVISINLMLYIYISSSDILGETLDLHVHATIAFNVAFIIRYVQRHMWEPYIGWHATSCILAHKHGESS